MAFRWKDSGMHPIRNDSIVISGSGPTRRATLALKNPNHDRAMSVLNNAIQTLDLVNNLVPLEIAKGVLASVAGILGIIKNTLANKGDFQELAEQCQMIGLVVWRATSGIPEDQINHTVRRALFDLKSSVDGILDAVEAKTKENVGSKVFHATVNQETIVKWRNELGRFLILFNTELNISANLKLDELLSSFHEFRSTVTFNLQANAQVPEVLPVRPKIFVGRDDLVRSTIQPLLQCRDVALIGPGGIGKSSIARAILNDETLTSRFHNRRFFIRYDDMDAAQITFGTFLDRIVRALGLAASANPHNSINKALSTSETLLVLDNAETFLDAAVDASRIADAIDGFGSRPNVAILLTTRTTVLPPNLEWIRLRVPALEEDAACDAFKLFYTPSIENSILIKLLSAVDFHPLSINLLAQAAVQNEWSPQDLVDAWDRQRTVLLEAGDGKIQSIAVTIETSLNSPSVVKFGDTIRHLLQVIAFLPQGISKKRLSAIFPEMSNIESCADALCRQSLGYLNGDFITLLAPIRLYISNHYNGQVQKNPLLERVRQYYAAHAGEEEIVRQDDVNMEHIFAHWVGDPKSMAYVLGLIGSFVYTLLDCRPRPISLRPVISALDPDRSRHSVSCRDSLKFFTFGQSLRRLQVSLAKGRCLLFISLLLRYIGQIVEAEDTLAEARAVLLETGRHGRIPLIAVYWAVGVMYIEQGNYQAAEGLFQAALERLSTMFRPNRDIKIFFRCALIYVKMYKGEPGAFEGCLEAMPVIRNRIGKAEVPRIIVSLYCNAGYAELHDGHLDIATKYFEEARASVDESSTECFATSLLGLAEMADYKGDHSEAKGLRARVLDLIQRMPDRTVAFASEATAVLAGYLAMEGNVEQARELIIPAVVNATKRISQRTLKCNYLAGMIELIDGDFDKARDHFQETLEECVSTGELGFRACSERALGEVAIVKGNLAKAREHFEATTELCKTMGIPKKCLYRNLACYIPSETFNGWKLYQEGNVMFHT